MRKFLFLLILQTIALCVFSAAVFPQDCKPPEIVFNKNAENIFSEEQETFLGDIMSEQVQKDYRIISDAEVNSLVRGIGEKLVGHLPPTDIKFKFYVVDLPEINAFITAGGRVYVTRKLIAFVRSEDELAGILAHELGHGTVRHGAIDMSRYFKKILGVEKVGDRNDIFEKYNRLIDLSRTKRVRTSNSHEDNQQLEADKIGVYAMTAAGYNPAAFSSAFDRLAGTEGKTGGWFSDLVGKTTPSQKRLGEIIKTVATLPAACQDKKSAVTAGDFEKWQTTVINYSGFFGTENVGEVFRRNDLSPDLRDDLNQLKFSQDGRYVLAQDDSGIFVLSREPFKFLFRIEAPEAKPAKFSPDSKSIVFDTETMRVERWNIAAQKPDSIKEIFLRENCFQTALSDDGKMFACFSLNVVSNNLEVAVKLINVETNETLYEKEKFYRPEIYEFVSFLRFSESNLNENIELFQTEFSPDGRYFLAGRVLKFSSRDYNLTSGITLDRVVNAGNSGILGFDLLRKQEIKIGSDLQKIISSPFAFYSNDQIIGQNSENPEKSGIYAFPSGKQIERFTLSGDSISKVHKGNYILVRPLKVAPVGVFDIDQKKFVVANNTPAFDAYDNVIVSENKTGVLGLYRLDKDEVVAEINLPESYFGNLRTVTVSPDLNWIAVSDKSRGAVWSLFSGNQTFYVQGFRGAYFDKTGKIYADFARTDKTPRQIASMDVRSKEMGAGREIQRPNTRQYGRFLLTSVGDDKPKKKDDKAEKPSYMIENPDDYPVREKGTIEVRDVVSDELLWSKKFSDEMPSRFFNPTKETMAFVWRLKSNSAKSIVKNDEKLRNMSSAMGDKDGDYLVQVIEAATGNVIGQTLIETGAGSFGIKRASADGDWLAITDTENRILFYSLADGSLKHRFFGGDATTSSEANLAAVENFAGQISIYNLTNGEKINELRFKTHIVTAQFDKYGKKLFVLTADQEALIFDTAKFAKPVN